MNTDKSLLEAQRQPSCLGTAIGSTFSFFIGGTEITFEKRTFELLTDPFSSFLSEGKYLQL